MCHVHLLIPLILNFRMPTRKPEESKRPKFLFSKSAKYFKKCTYLTSQNTGLKEKANLEINEWSTRSAFSSRSQNTNIVVH